MKKFIYIALFTILGIILSFLVHAVLELTAINFLVSDFQRYNLGLSWSAWFGIHAWGSVLLLIFGVVGGAIAGQYWWKKLYVNGDRDKDFGP